jgi:hypothetical protein
MITEPRARESRNFLEFARLFEQVSGTRHDLQPRLRRHALHGALIHPDHGVIQAAHDEQRRRLHFRKGITCQIGAPAARNNRSDPIRPRRGGDQCGTTSCARPEQADGQVPRSRLLAQPAHRVHESVGQQLDIEADVRGVLVYRFLLRAQ